MSVSLIDRHIDSDKKIHKEYLYAKLIHIFGEEKQEIQFIEEMAELTQAILHKHRGRKNNIPEEIADVEIMLEQLKIINQCEKEVEEIKKQKLERLAERLSE